MDASNRYVDGRYLAGHEDWHAGRSEWKAAQVERMLERNRLEPSSILDVGCGAGRALNVLAAHRPGARCVGVDPSGEAIALTDRGELEPNVTLEVRDLADIDETFDVALALDVFEHVEDYIGFLRALGQIARWSVFHIPLDMSAHNVVRRGALDAKRNAVGHLHYFNRATALATLREVGYDVEDDFYTASHFEGPQRGARDRLRAWPRRLFFRVDPDLAVATLGGYSLCVLARNP